MTSIERAVEGLPETEKLYLTDSYVKTCSATVIRIIKHRGARRHIVLDRTVFHPLAGGQPSDTGLIEGEGFRFQVKKALLHKGVVLHFGKLTGREPEEGESVECVLDWERRYLVMRLHTAGHILDAAVSEYFGRCVDTLGANHGPPAAYVDYDHAPPDARALASIEESANRIAASDLEVKIKFVEAERLAEEVYNAPNLDRLPKASSYRIVEIVGVNAIPCTGTHVVRTKEVGRIELLSLEELSRGFRLRYRVV